MAKARGRTEGNNIGTETNIWVMVAEPGDTKDNWVVTKGRDIGCDSLDMGSNRQGECGRVGNGTSSGNFTVEGSDVKWIFQGHKWNLGVLRKGGVNKGQSSGSAIN